MCFALHLFDFSVTLLLPETSLTSHNVVLTFESGWNPEVWPLNWKFLSSTFLWCCLLCYRMMYKLGPFFESVNEILKCDQSNESCWAVLICGAVYYALQGGSHFWVWEWNPKVWPFKWKLLSSTFLWCCLLCCTRWFSLLSLRMKS